MIVELAEKIIGDVTKNYEKLKEERGLSDVVIGYGSCINDIKIILYSELKGERKE